MRKVFTLQERVMNGSVTLSYSTSCFATRELAEKAQRAAIAANDVPEYFGPRYWCSNIKETKVFESEDEVPILREMKKTDPASPVRQLYERTMFYSASKPSQVAYYEKQEEGRPEKGVVKFTAQTASAEETISQLHDLTMSKTKHRFGLWKWLCNLFGQRENFKYDRQYK